MTVRHSPIRLLGVRTPVRLSLVFLSATLAASLTQSVRADAIPAATPASGDAVQQPYYGVLNQDNVYVRSGPSDVFYATAKLSKGAKVTVVAVREPWLKIVPPDGSYRDVARAYVEKRGDGTVGRVTKAELNVRAGSTLNGLKTTVLTSLAEGDDVKILGEQDEYFKIAPPPGAYLYIMKTYVDPAPQAVGEQPIVASAKTSDPIASAPIPAAVTPPAPVPAVPAPAPVAPAPAPVAAAPVPVAPTPAPVTAVVPAAPVVPTPAPVPAAPAALPVISMAPVPTTRPAEASSAVPATQPAVAVVPTTQPIQATPADSRFDTLESTFLEATSLPLDQQPLDKMLTEYTALSADPSLPASMRRITEMRIATVKLRSDAQKQYLEAKKMDADAQARTLALKAEHEELVQKVKDQQLSIYTVLGTLRISSLQQSGTTLYRLTDPGTGRTMVYLKSNDPKYSGLLNQFVGVKGDITEDSNLNLKVISPTGVETVDPAKVNTTVTATLIPPSMLPKTATVSLGN